MLGLTNVHLCRVSEVSLSIEMGRGSMLLVCEYVLGSWVKTLLYDGNE